MKAFKIIRNNESENFTSGTKKYFSSYDKAADYIFNHNAKFYFRHTEDAETREGLESKLSHNQWNTVRVEDTPDGMSDILGLTPEAEYYHIIVINID